MVVVCLSVPCLTLSREWKEGHSKLKMGRKEAHGLRRLGPGACCFAPNLFFVAARLVAVVGNV